MLTGMRVTTVNSASSARGAGTALEAVRPAGKASDSARFRGERENEPGETLRPRPRLQVELVCQQETKRHDPFWDGPRLVPVFVAQLLGQVLEHPARAAPARPYAASMPVARVFDASL